MLVSPGQKTEGGGNYSAGYDTRHSLACKELSLEYQHVLIQRSTLIRHLNVSQITKRCVDLRNNVLELRLYSDTSDSNQWMQLQANSNERP